MNKEKLAAALNGIQYPAYKHVTAEHKFAYHWLFGNIEFTGKDFGADVVEWKLSDTKPTA